MALFVARRQHMGNVDELMEGEGVNIDSRQTSQYKWLKIVLRLMYPDYCLLAHRQKSSGRLSAIGAQSARGFIQPRPRHSWLCSFFIPGIAARNNSQRGADSENPAYFQSAVRKQSVAPRWRVTVRCEFNGLHYCQAQTIIRTEMEMMVFFLVTASQSEDLTMQRMEELRVVKYKL